MFCAHPDTNLWIPKIQHPKLNCFAGYFGLIIKCACVLYILERESCFGKLAVSGYFTSFLLVVPATAAWTVSRLFGEGRCDLTQKLIRQLLKLNSNF